MVPIYSSRITAPGTPSSRASRSSSNLHLEQAACAQPVRPRAGSTGTINTDLEHAGASPPSSSSGGSKVKSEVRPVPLTNAHYKHRHHRSHLAHKRSGRAAAGRDPANARRGSPHTIADPEKSWRRHSQ
ncbi:hypothetical protein BAUCODRAFT_34027 [Baudoinia panamericana UAMH 10762]|uniref:Uncharacterized protein n=1 Tax=Baudoinia panamericana (strain UAMH 10762) TaxID=717646 RepID=M2NCM5_BAUPA|nr:uncharacterized protein BAUCODRAFT_34027 [Baudoinia panamericana UAMH 10762]EMC96650.1 hypothetical protein BAUCODRAFT_34027 [Baudoinia panamericana UAMH 10762]